MEIRSIRIDLDKDTLEINGKKVEKPVIVTLPGPDEWPIQKLFNPESYIPESVKVLCGAGCKERYRNSREGRTGKGRH